MGIRDLVDRLCGRLHDIPQYPTQGSTLFVDLERKETRASRTATPPPRYDSSTSRLASL